MALIEIAHNIQIAQSYIMKITTESQLRELYGFPSGRAAKKSLLKLEQHAKNFISKSPFVVMATVSGNGLMDNSPRGGKPGFVHVLDDSHVVIPDSKGNNRLDSLVNIVENGCVGLFFLLPGIDETLRINGTAEIRCDQALLDRFKDEKNLPKTCLVIRVEEVFLHCAKALMRSKLWLKESQVGRVDFPTMGQMLKDQLNGPEAVESHQDMVKRYLKDL